MSDDQKSLSSSMRNPVLVLALLCALSGLPAVLQAAPSVRVLALFPGKAMLEIEGRRKVLAAGESGPQGVRLISADTREAVVEIGGRREVLRLGSTVSATYVPSERREIRILKGRGGYFLDGLINGQSVRFLVDTGATSVALSERHAAHLGLQHRVDGVPVGIGTASGDALGHAIVLGSLSIGGIRLNDVRAVVIEGDSPRHALLGMNVLSRFEIDQRENLLILRSKF
jgi:aspartyl protease family protein